MKYLSFILAAPIVFVYICKGPSSKAYHINKDCKGLSKCSTPVYEVRSTYAIDTLKRTKCHFCVKQ